MLLDQVHSNVRSALPKEVKELKKQQSLSILFGIEIECVPLPREIVSYQQQADYKKQQIPFYFLKQYQNY